MESTETHLDMESLLELKEVMEDDFPLLINTYLYDAEKRMLGLHEAAGNNDAEGVRCAAHSFKGSSSNIGAILLVNLLQSAEDCGLNQEMDSISSLVIRIDAEYAEVKQLLHQQIN